MRILATTLLSVFLFGCSSVAPPPATSLAREQPAVADATFAAGADTAPAVVALDPVVAQLLRASFAACEHQRRVLHENIANVNTWAYKRRVVRTATQAIAGSDATTFQMPVIAGTDTVFSPGALEITERWLDVAIDGEGFFAVTRPDGTTGYTRDGRLQLNADGKLVTGDGCVVMPEIIVVSDTLEIFIAPDGVVAGRTAGAPDTTTTFGQLVIHRFVNPAGLRSESGGWRPSELSGAPFSNRPGLGGLGTLKQGFLERSNVQLADELLQMQMLERQHQALVRTLRQFGLVAP